MPFHIDPFNGTIFTKSKIYKSYKRYGYEFYAMAAVGSVNATVKVKIKILDINDLVPEFSQQVYHVNISEEATAGLPLLTLMTKASASSSSLDFLLIDSYDVFLLVKQSNSRAFLTIQRSNLLSYKKNSSYELQVKVTDQEGLYSTAVIYISVTPADLFTPRFQQSNFKFQIYENASVDSLIGIIQAQLPSSSNR